MEIIQVEFPLMKVIPLRKAEVGQILEAEVYGRNDHLIAERGTKVDEQLLTRFENFDVQRIVVREEEETWITDEQIGNLPTEAQVTQRRTVRGRLAEHTRELFGKNFDRTMSQLLEEGMKEARDRDRVKLVQELEEQQTVVDDLSERVATVQESLTDLPEKTRSRIQTVLRGTALDLGRDFLQLPGSEAKLRKYLVFFKDRDEARNQLIQILSEYSDVFEDVEQPDEAPPREAVLSDPLRDLVSNGTREQLVEEVNPERRSELNEEAERILEQQERLGRQLVQESSSEQMGHSLIEASEQNTLVNHKTLKSVTDEEEASLPDRVQELLRKRENLQKKVQGVLKPEKKKSAEDEDDSKESEPSTDSVKKLLDVFDAGQRKKAVQASIGFLRKQDADTEEYEKRFAELFADIKELQNENNELHEAVEESARHPEDREYLERLMDGDEEFDPDRLLEMDVDMMLVEKIESHLKQRAKAQDRFEDIMWDVKTDGRIKK
jgi:hypothetical protein